ncbi:hypothetical protein LAZ67_X003561 [Cordylochernes scorpioides]|uniref:Reverse transcriptase n=1 Tax=Cordylochernes scorpioides TaxID=51811 RepID=A0ABY6LUH2_9ARAC|nr:hypothetical protein LAZ67_X003561 [Cordylochernes scorpioides]
MTNDTSNHISKRLGNPGKKPRILLRWSGWDCWDPITTSATMDERGLPIGVPLIWNGIVNLSSIPLSEKEERVLALGLHYVPPDKPDIPRLIAGVEGALKNLNHMETLRIRHAVTQVLRRPYHPVSYARDHLSLIQKLRKTSSLAKQITKAQLTQFTGSLTRDAYIYGAPKIHKPGVPLRPIIAYHLSPAPTLAKYLAQLLSPIMKNNPNHTFTFNHQHYKQIRGTPMGSPLSSIVAEVVMGSLDQWINQMHSSDIHYWRRILRPYGIQVYFNSPPNLAALLRNPITKADAPNNPIHSTGAVYAVSCQDCPASYVGETGRTASESCNSVVRMTIGVPLNYAPDQIV